MTENGTVAEEATVSAEAAGSTAEENTAKEGAKAPTEQAVESQGPQAAEQPQFEASDEANGEDKLAVTSGTEIEPQTIELSKKSFATFCTDIAGMFSVAIKCKQQKAAAETIEGLEERFGKPVAVNCIKAEGVLDGTFQIIFGREGLFILAGAIAMPEQMTSLLEKCVGPANIQKNIKSGSLKEAEAVRDTIAEAGNMLVGSWDRVFREEMDGHGHFVQTNTFIGDPWDNPEEKMGLASDQELLLISYEVTIELYSPFGCGVIFPEAVFHKAKAEAKIRAEAEAKAKAEAEKEKAKSEEKASEADESAAKEEAEASAEEKDAASDANSTDDAAEEEVAAPDRSEESAMGGVSKAIQEMTQSSAGFVDESSRISLATSAKDIMQKGVVWGSPDDSVQHALTTMQQHDTGYLMVGKDGVLEGIVSNSNITGAISPYLRPMFAKWRRPLDDATLNIRVKWMMSRPVRTIRPGTPLAVIIENMLQLGDQCLPVVNKGGKVEGSVTVFDIFKVLLNSNPGITTVGKSLQAPPLVQLDS